MTNEALSLASLLAVLNTLAGQGTLQQRAAKAVTELARIEQADAVSLRMVDSSGGLLLVAGVGTELLAEPMVLPRGSGIAGDSAANNREIVVTDPAELQQRSPALSATGLHAAAAFPVRAGGRTFGTLFVASRQAGYFTPARLELLRACADAFGPLEENGALHEDAALQREFQKITEAFISVVTHELRTPLTTISGFSEYLLEREHPAEIQRQALQAIHAEARRMSQLAEDFLNAARTRSRDLTVKLEPVPLRPLAEELVTRRKAVAPQHQFILDSSLDGPVVLADREKLIQVLTNLLSNAVKYSPKGGQVTLSCAESRDGKRWTIAVADEGLGIPIEEQGGLFNLFRRVRTTETEHIPGTGVGLFVVRTLVERMNGEVWLRSQPGRGSTFYVSLPKAS